MYSLRRFISLVILFTFIVMSYTGIVLFLSPKGRVANWTNWELLGLDKTQYTNLHVTFMVLFIVGMIFHIYFNWGALFIYLTNKAREFSLFTKEFILALGINLLFLLGTLYYWTPFEQFLDFQYDIRRKSIKRLMDMLSFLHLKSLLKKQDARSRPLSLDLLPIIFKVLHPIKRLLILPKKMANPPLKFLRS